MKKNLSILSLALAPTVVFAAGTAMTGNTTVTANNCSLLQDDLKIGLSNGVVGAYNCDTTSTQPSVLISACHTGGRVSSRTATVQVPAGCGTSANSAACTNTSSTVTGAVVPTATTLGGSLKSIFPGATCDSAGATAKGVI